MSFYKKLISLRKNPEYKETLVYGDVIPYLEEQKNLMAYYRKGEKSLLVLGNFQKDAQSVVLPSSSYKVLLNNCPATEISSGEIQMEGYQVLVLEL